MKKLAAVLLSATLLLSGCLTAPPQPASLAESIDFDAGGLLVPVEINGQSYRLSVTTGSLGGIVLNPDAAARAGLSGLRSVIQVGTVQVRGETRVNDMTIDGWTGSQRLAWFDRPIDPSADGIISIARLPYERVVRKVRPPSPDERELTFDITNTFFSDINFMQEIEGETLTVRFEPELPHSSLSAAAGALLAKSHGGTWNGEARMIAMGFGIERPARPMRFAEPLFLNGLAIDRVMVRTSDYNGKEQLPLDEVSDPSEIVVTASSKQKPAYILSIGGDVLSACSSMTYVREPRKLAMSCRSR